VLTLSPLSQENYGDCDYYNQDHNSNHIVNVVGDACAAAGHHAIVFGDLKDPQSAVSKALQAAGSRQIREDLNLNTGVRYTSI